MIQKAFSIGNSVAVTLPKASGVISGSKMKYLGKRKNRISYEVLEDQPNKSMKASGVAETKEKEAYLKKIMGTIKLDISTEEFMKFKEYCREHPYEKVLKWNFSGQ